MLAGQTADRPGVTRDDLGRANVEVEAVSREFLIKVAFTHPMRYPCVVNAIFSLDRNDARTLYYTEAVEIG